jgi:hypothetical protein
LSAARFFKSGYVRLCPVDGGNDTIGLGQIRDKKASAMTKGQTRVLLGLAALLSGLSVASLASSNGPETRTSLRGLPSEEDLKLLISHYVVVQRKLWPKLAKANILPELDDASLGRHVAAYKDRYAAKAPTPFGLSAGDVSAEALGVRARCLTLPVSAIGHWLISGNGPRRPSKFFGISGLD